MEQGQTLSDQLEERLIEVGSKNHKIRHKLGIVQQELNSFNVSLRTGVLYLICAVFVDCDLDSFLI